MVKIRETDTGNGNTENDYQTIFTLTDTSKFSEITFLISNNGNKGLTYKITCFAHVDGVEYTLYEEDILTYITVEKVVINDAYDKIVVYVKSKLADNPTNMNMDYIAQYKENISIK